jgi:hypothetical protein
MTNPTVAYQHFSRPNPSGFIKDLCWFRLLLGASINTSSPTAAAVTTTVRSALQLPTASPIIVDRSQSRTIAWPSAATAPIAVERFLVHSLRDLPSVFKHNSFAPHRTHIQITSSPQRSCSHRSRRLCCMWLSGSKPGRPQQT